MDEKEACECGCADCEHMGKGAEDDKPLTPEELAAAMDKERGDE